MAPKNEEALRWLTAQVAAARADGGIVESASLYEALRLALPNNPMTLDELCKALVQLTAGTGVAVQFGEPSPESNGRSGLRG